jgi:hypothetical protein
VLEIYSGPAWFGQPSVGPLHPITSVRAPWSLFVAVFALMPGTVMITTLRRRRRKRRRAAAGLCLDCGYDLRAHTRGELCPECGAANLQPA